VERFERVLNEFLKTDACSATFGFALQRNDSSDNSTSFREHFSHNGTFWEQRSQSAVRKITTDYIGSKRLRRFALESREQAVHETRSPWCRYVLAFVFVSHSLLFTLSEEPG